MTATTYDATIGHARREPLVNRFSYRSRMWLVDLDRIPRLPTGLRWLARFEARDHLGDPDGSLRGNVERFLAANGIDLAGGRVLMLANARAFGHVFNPLSVHWCERADGSLAAVVAEVHNTYGDRHAYLLRPDDTGTVDAAVDKAMYVSPFNPVAGTYRIVVSPPRDEMAITVTLHRSGQPPFVAALRGRRRPERPVLRAALSTALTSLRVSALIRWQGIRLWRRGLPIEPRPAHARQEAVS